MMASNIRRRSVVSKARVCAARTLSWLDSDSQI
jgi:hypothetical protein